MSNLQPVWKTPTPEIGDSDLNWLWVLGIGYWASQLGDQLVGKWFEFGAPSLPLCPLFSLPDMVILFHLPFCMLFLAVSAGLCASLCYLDTTKNLKKKKIQLTLVLSELICTWNALSEWENMNKKNTWLSQPTKKEFCYLKKKNIT